MNTDRIPRDAQRDSVPGADRARGAWTTASIIPARCTDSELLHGLGFSHATFYRLKAKGTFRALEIAMPGANTQYSGALILRWLAGEKNPTVASSSARPYFGKKSAQVLAMPARRGRRPGRPRTSVSALHVQESNEAGDRAPLNEVENAGGAR